MGQKGQKKAQPTLNKHEVADCMIMLRSSNTCSAIHCTSLATNSCSVRNSLPAMNTASPTSAYLQHHHFWKSGAKRSSQIRCFKTPLSISSLCSQLPQCNPSCTRVTQRSSVDRKVFCLLFSKQFCFQDVIVCCGKAPSHCLETQLLGNICSKTKSNKSTSLHLISSDGKGFS